MSSKGRAGKESDNGTQAVLGNQDFISNVFNLPSGMLNPLEPPIAISERLSLSDSPTSLLRATVKRSNTPDLTTGISHFKGIVLRIEDQSEKPSFLSEVTDAIGLTKAEGYIKARVLVPEMHKMLPRPFGKGHPEYPNKKNENDLVIDLYPIFESINNNPEFSEIQVGEIVTISYRSKNNYTTSGTPIIVSRYMSTLANIGQAADCTDTNTYNAAPPPGDPLADGQRQTSHTGGDSAALRSRNKRSVSQLFLHNDSGEELAKNMTTMMASRGYVLKTSDLKPGKGAKIVELPGNVKFYSHNLTLSQFLDADELLIPEGEHFLTSAESVTISYRLPYEDAASLNGYNAEIDKVKKLFKQLISLIDSRAKGSPSINFILDPNWDFWDDIRVQACKNLASDVSFKSEFTDGTLRLNFFDTIPKSAKGTFDHQRQASTKLDSNGAAIFTQNIASAFKQRNSERPAIKKKPAPVIGPKISPNPPSAADIDSIIKGVLASNQFSSTSDAEEFLNAISTKMNVDLDTLITSDPQDPSSFLNVGITPDLASDIAGQSISPNEAMEYVDKLKTKIRAAIDFSASNSFVNPSSQPQSAIPATNLGIPKRGTPRAPAASPGACNSIAEDQPGADDKGLKKKQKVARSFVTSGTLPGVQQERYAFVNSKERKSTSYVIIHNPSAPMRSPGSLANALNNKRLGVHFVVTSSGKTVQMFDMSKALVHAKGVNLDSIAIEVQNSSKLGMTSKHYTPTTAAACEATWQLIKKICKNSSIPLAFPPANSSRGTFYNGHRAHKYGGLRPGIVGHGHFEAHPLSQHSDGKFEILYMALRKRGLSAANAYAEAVKVEKAYNARTPKAQRAKGHRLAVLKVPALKTGKMSLVDLAADMGLNPQVFAELSKHSSDTDDNGIPDSIQRPDGIDEKPKAVAGTEKPEASNSQSDV